MSEVAGGLLNPRPSPKLIRQKICGASWGLKWHLMVILVVCTRGPCCKLDEEGRLLCAGLG